MPKHLLTGGHYQRFPTLADSTAMMAELSTSKARKYYLLLSGSIGSATQVRHMYSIATTITSETSKIFFVDNLYNFTKKRCFNN